MKEAWKEVCLGDVCEISSSKRIYASDYVEKGIPFYRSKEIIEAFNGKKISLALFIDVNKYKKIKDKYGVPEVNDILLTSVGTIGIPFIVKNTKPFYFKDGNLIWLKTSKSLASVEPKFLYSFITSDFGKGKLDSVLIGSSQKALTISGLNNLKINLPPLPTQQKIANILSAYDDLIENNIKRIELLKEQAQLNYEEWFVRMKFPDHENTKIDAETGLPEKWEDTKIGEVFKTSSGGTPSKTKEAEYYENGDIPWVRTGELKQFILIESERYITEVGLKESSAKMFPKNTVLLAMYGNTIGETTFAAKSVSTNQACCAFLVEDDKEFLSYFIHQYLLYNKEYVLNFRMGAAQENISQGIIKNIEIRIPSTDILLKFEELIKPLYLLIENLAKQNKYLKEARDILLPRLMMGIIEV